MAGGRGRGAARRTLIALLVALAAGLGDRATAAPGLGDRATAAPVPGAAPAGLAATRSPAGLAATARAASGQLSAARRLAVPGGGAVHRYRQRVGGLPVLGAELVVADPSGGPARVVIDDTVRGLEPPPRPPQVGRGAAIARARAATGARRPERAARARLGIDPRTGRAVWEVGLAGAADEAWLVVVDASTGAATRVRDLVREAGRASASASLFNPNPVVTRGGYGGLRDRDDRDSAVLAGQRTPVALPGMTGVRGCLRGTAVEVRLGPRQRKVCNRGLDWTGVQRSANVFEALMAYHHVATTRAYLDSLGLSRPLGARIQRVVANGTAADNSFYSPFGRLVVLGSGGVDDGEDADVIIHEYGHAIQDAQVRHFGDHPEGAAAGEGFADYLAAVMSARATGGSARFDPCMFEWDALSYAGRRCVRRTDLPLGKQSARQRCGSEPHCVGQAWSGALWALREQLGDDREGRSIGDRIVLESHFLLTRSANFRDAARALLAADALLYGGAHEAPLRAELVERGFLGKEAERRRRR